MSADDSLYAPIAIDGEAVRRMLAPCRTPPDCTGCGALWVQLPAGHWGRLDVHQYSCTGPQARYPEVTTTRKETTE